MNINTIITHVHDDKSLSARQITFIDIELRVMNELGDTVEDECACDSTYTIVAMDRVGQTIMKDFHWISANQICYLVMDNAGGHGTKEVIQQYYKNLLGRYCIEIIWQVPMSPYTNVLDLGVWMALHARVERQHYLKCATTNALVNSVNLILNTADLYACLVKLSADLYACLVKLFTKL